CHGPPGIRDEAVDQLGEVDARFPGPRHLGAILGVAREHCQRSGLAVQWMSVRDSEPRPFPGRRLARFVPPILWMGLIAIGSSSLMSGSQTGPWILWLLGHLAPWARPALLGAAHYGLRQVRHLTECGVLAILWHRALAPAPRAAWVAFVLAAVYGGVDELRQGLAPDRTPALSDVAVDALGAWIGLAAWLEPGPTRPATLRAAAWTVGLLAGLSLLAAALDAALGRSAVDLTVATVGLGLVAAGLARL